MKADVELIQKDRASAERLNSCSTLTLIPLMIDDISITTMYTNDHAKDRQKGR
jgi:hypothetical protein